MVIREADGQLDISGSPAELNAVADRIEQLAAGAELSVGANAAADPRPYKRCLVAMEVKGTDGPVRLVVADDRVVATGSVSMLPKFASFFRFEATASRGAHNHYEWFDGNDCIARGSAPLVVSVG